MNRQERERVDDYVRDFRMVLRDHPKYEKYKNSVRVDQGCAAMLIGYNRNSAAFATITREMDVIAPGVGFGKRKMYALRDLASAIVTQEGRF